MALSSIHEVANHGNNHNTNGANEQTNNGCNIERNTDTDKQFRPNPDAKPFIPNPLTVAAAKWHIYSNENGKNVNGVVSPYWMAPHVDRENVVVAGSSSSPLKKHIAFHLVSNVLDDEVPEESVKDVMSNILHNSHHSNIYGSIMSEQIDSWQTSPSNFSLPLGADKSSSDKRSINNKSIHEIWSPDPSPNGLNNLSPSDEVLSTYHAQQQLLDSPNSIIDSPEMSFEHVQNEISTPNFTSGRLQNYEELDIENIDDVNHSLNYCYQNIPSPVNVPSPVYAQYDYRNVNRQEAPDLYQTMMLQKNEMVNNDTNSMVLEQNDYYTTFAHYLDRYQPVVGENRFRARNKYDQIQPTVQMSYELKVSFMEELGISLDECRDQLRHLERDFRKADTSLTQEFRLRRSSGSDSGSLKYPPNSTRVDKLVIDQQREHQKVESLIGRIERLGFTPMHPNVGVALDLWLTGIKDLRNVRKNELANLNDGPPLNTGGSKSHMQADICNLIASVKELTKHTRSARTIVWCALQMLYASIPNGSSSGE